MFPLKKGICMVEFPSNLGLKELYPGREPGVKHLPDWLRKHRLHEYINPSEVLRLEAPSYTMHLDEESGVRNADLLVDYAIKQNEVLHQVLEAKRFPFVIGGDCSILLGPLLHLRQMGNYALFYLDGHTDFIWPPLSSTGGAGGMAAAFAAGKGPEKLTNILNLRPYIKEEQVWCVGNREYEEWYEQTIIESKATYLSLARLRADGIKSAVTSFLKMVYSQNLAGFWIHFDVDVLNDEIMPAVDSRTPDGLHYPELHEILLPLLADPKAAGLTLTILDPDLDPTGDYTIAFVEQIRHLFKNLK
jgi:arginase